LHQTGNSQPTVNVNNYVPKHTWHHADSEYASGVDVHSKGAEFSGNIHSQTQYGMVY